jgi:hypothetical protein
MARLHDAIERYSGQQKKDSATFRFHRHGGKRPAASDGNADQTALMPMIAKRR